MISVCIASYNGEKYIEKQIQSILCQLGKDDEIIVSDDGSKDGTLQIIANFNDDRIKIYNNENRHGYVGNFENALSKSKGEYIFLSDQDDIWKVNKVSTILNLLNKCDLVVHDAELIGGNDESLNKTYYSIMHNKTNFWMNFWKTRFLGCCMAFTARLKEDCLPFPKEIVAHDYWIGMYALTRYQVEFISDILISYRRHDSNVSSSSGKSNTSICYKLFIKRMSLIYAICKKCMYDNKLK